MRKAKKTASFLTGKRTLKIGTPDKPASECHGRHESKAGSNRAQLRPSWCAVALPICGRSVSMATKRGYLDVEALLI